ncbi:MAG: AMP-binding protein, partial [bacterium]
VLHHRGAYLNSLGNVLALGFGKLTKYLWTLPMFHCNGWCHTWAITAAGGTHVCLDRVDPALIVQALHEQGITHFSCAPVVLYMLLGHTAIEKFQPTRRVTVATGGASPTSRLIENMEKLGFDFIHLYGLTESFGPTSLRLLSQLEEKLNTEEKAELLARQGVRHTTANRIQVLDESGKDVPWDGITNGEIVLSGNTLFAGYYRNPEATEAAFRSGGFHTGDIAVVHPNGDFEIRDRSKDIIISGGENISSLEVEAVLHNHPDVSIAAVVARPDEQWGEVPCAFIELKQGKNPTPEELRLHCRSALAGFKVPKFFIFCDLPKTATGKIRKVELRDQAKKL